MDAAGPKTESGFNVLFVNIPIKVRLRTFERILLRCSPDVCHLSN